MNNLTEESVLQALRSVQDPDLRQDLVTLGMIQDLKITAEGKVFFRVVLTTPACPLKAKIEQDCRAAVGTLSEVSSVDIQMDARVRNPSQDTRSKQIEGVSHIIAVSSGKGGVGKSTVSANLAVSLALEGAKVGLMDADVYGPNIPTMMGVIDGPKLEKHPVLGEFFVPPKAHGVKIMSMGFLIQGDQPLVWRGPMLHSVVQQFCHRVNWGQLDYLIIDLPPGTGDVQLSLAQLVPLTGAVLVTTPQEVSLQDVRKAFYMFEKVRVPLIGVVENMSYFVCDGCSKKHYLFGQQGGRQLSKKFNTELLGEIPLVPEIRVGGDEGVPLVLKDPNSAASRQLREMARKIAQQASVIAHNATDSSQRVEIGRFS